MFFFINRISVLSVISILLLVNSCSIRAKPPEVMYLIPQTFEGPVVVLYDQQEGFKPSLQEKKYVFRVPDDGIIKVNIGAETAGGEPSFFLVAADGNKSQIELLFHWGRPYPNGLRTKKDISEDERDNTVFAMLYEQGSFNISNGASKIRYRTFLIGKPKDDNVLNTKMNQAFARIRTTFPR